jgi:hypothetical protein
MAAYRVGLADFGDSFSACVFDLLGCWINAQDRDEVLALAPIAIAAHETWLANGGIDSPRNDRVEVEVTEDLVAADEPGVEGEFCFKDDLRALTPAEIEHGIRIMELSRTDLLSSLTSCTDAVLDWRPPRNAMARIDVWKPEPLTIREITLDIASAESYYRTALHDGRDDDGDEGGPRQLGAERVKLVESLRALSDASRARLFEPIRPWQSAPERWTARKVTRRVISHERFHTAEIRQRLTWLHLGVPRFRE